MGGEFGSRYFDTGFVGPNCTDTSALRNVLGIKCPKSLRLCGTKFPAASVG